VRCRVAPNKPQETTNSARNATTQKSTREEVEGGDTKAFSE